MSPAPSRLASHPDQILFQSSQTQAIGRGGVGNIRSRSRARATSHVTEGHPQTASILSEAAASNAEYERNVIQAREEAAKTVVSLDLLNFLHFSIRAYTHLSRFIKNTALASPYRWTFLISPSCPTGDSPTSLHVP